MKSRVYRLLLEALRRYCQFHSGEPLTQAWTGLGTLTEYKSVLDEGYMQPALLMGQYNAGPHRPRENSWFRLTEKGAEIVQSWMDQGFTHEDILDFYFSRSSNLPPIPRP
jgi:hypothetical protein